MSSSASARCVSLSSSCCRCCSLAEFQKLVVSLTRDGLISMVTQEQKKMWHEVSQFPNTWRWMFFFAPLWRFISVHAANRRYLIRNSLPNLSWWPGRGASLKSEVLYWFPPVKLFLPHIFKKNSLKFSQNWIKKKGVSISQRRRSLKRPSLQSSNRVPFSCACDFVPILGPFPNKKSWVVWFAYQICCGSVPSESICESPASCESIVTYVSSAFLSFFFFFFFFSIPLFSGVRHPGEPAGWKSGGGLRHIWEQVRQLPEVHGVQRAGLPKLQAAEAGGVGSTRRPHRALPTAPWSVTTCRKHSCRGR